jgi:hypothetical protein
VTSTYEWIWALSCLAIGVLVAAASRRIGRHRAGGWLVVVGLVVLTVEEPGLTLWLAMADPSVDPDGLATLVTPMARAHLIDLAIFGVGTAVLLGRLALTALRSGTRTGWRTLTWAWVLTALALFATSTLVHSRGLALPGPAGDAGRDGLGWQPIVVALLVWAGGLWLARPTPALTEAGPAPHPTLSAR